MIKAKAVEIYCDYMTGNLQGESIKSSQKKLGELSEIFEDKEAFQKMNGDEIVYHVQMHDNGEDGKNGGLFFGTSFLHPGKVGDEFYMTKGHFHEKLDAAEYYWCIEGHGYLILQDEMGNCKVEEMKKGSLHYIPGGYAHRLVNVGETLLSVGAGWPSAAGHNYKVARSFNVKIKGIQGKIVIENNV